MIVSLTIAWIDKPAVSDLFEPSVPVAIFKIIQAAFMVVGFFFENNVAVSQIMLSVPH